jgi:hypothetical protein
MIYKILLVVIPSASVYLITKTLNHFLKSCDTSVTKVTDDLSNVLKVTENNITTVLKVSETSILKISDDLNNVLKVSETSILKISDDLTNILKVTETSILKVTDDLSLNLIKLDKLLNNLNESITEAKKLVTAVETTNQNVNNLVEIIELKPIEKTFKKLFCF